MSTGGCQGELLRLLAYMPFLDRLDMAAMSGRSRSVVYSATGGLEKAGLVAAVPHASPLILPHAAVQPHRCGSERVGPQRENAR